jgi:heme/copper-type cytochrome/quinol oxidase subunit 3
VTAVLVLYLVLALLLASSLAGALAFMIHPRDRAGFLAVYALTFGVGVAFVALATLGFVWLS